MQSPRALALTLTLHACRYDKYEYRNEMTQILEYLWAQPNYKQTMIGFARDSKRFTRFVNMLINDSIYSFDEALSKLAAIRHTQARILILLMI